MENPDLDNALLTIIAEVKAGVISPSQAMTEIKQAFAYYTKPISMGETRSGAKPEGK